MTRTKTQALVLNCGSSSVKYGVFDLQGEELVEICSGLVDKIGLTDTVIKHTVGEKTDKIEGALANHNEAMRKVVELLSGPSGVVKNISDIKVVGHRVVHGGPKYGEPTVLDATSIEEIKRCIPLAPLHNPANLMGVEQAQAVFKVAHVAVFDTAFHATMPPECYRYAIPKDLFENHSLRRYGFHGTSYKYVAGEVARQLKQPLENLNMIICHLGNGASMACVKRGRCVDTTMGLTPLEGLVMGTRSGDVDPGVYTFLCDHLKKSTKDVDTLLNKKSGLLGLSGTNDMREVIANAKKGDQDAQLARNVYVRRVRKYLGSFLVELDGVLDALVFTAGVGENDREFWSLATAGLERTLGIDVDPAKAKSVRGGGEIQSSSSRSKVLVVPTQEELEIATQSLNLIGIKVGGNKVESAPATSKSMSSLAAAPKGPSNQQDSFPRAALPYCIVALIAGVFLGQRLAASRTL